MNLPEACIRRPVMTTLLMATFLIFGLFAFKQLPVAALPRVDFPTINVSARLPGASPETMASSIAAPLEREFASISGITSMSSVSQQGSTSITLQFDLNRNIDGAALDVQAALSATTRRLPPELPAPPSFRKVNPADQPVLFMVLTSATKPLYEVHEFGENILQQQISQLPGVAQVNIFGAQKYAVRVRVNPDAVSARGLALSDVRSAIAAANSNSPVGTLNGTNQRMVLGATGQMERANEYGNLIISQKNGVPIRLSDVAQIFDSVENDQTGSWYNGQRSIMLAVYRQSDANTVQVVDSIKSRLDAYRAQLPAAIDLVVLNDRSIPIREAVEDVEVSLMIAIALVVMVIFLFLKSFAATVIPTLALPISLVGTFAIMHALGYSLDTISLLALTLAVGFVVDDAIVMLENIIRHIEMGKKPFQAALDGSREIGFTILSITISLVAVFIPVFFMGGVVGKVFAEFAGTIAAAIIVSGFVSLTLTPMLCARFLKAHDHHKKPNIVERVFEAGFQGMLSAYRWTLDAVLKARFLMLLLTLGTVYVSVQLYIDVPKGFFPTEDTGLLRGATEGPPDTSFEAMAARQMRVAEIVKADPAIDYLTSNIGGFNATNNGFMFIALKPKDQRDKADVVIARLRRAVSEVPGITAVFQQVQNINLNAGRSSRAQYLYSLQGPDLGALFNYAPLMQQRLAQLPQLRDANIDLQLRNPQLSIEIDRERAASLGISSDQIRQALGNAFGSRQIATIFTPATDYQVIMEAERAYQQDPAVLSRLLLKAANGQNVPLETVATIKPSVGPLAVNRISQQPAVTISFNTAPGVSLGDAVNAIRAAEREINLPASIVTSFAGSAQLFQDALKGQGLLIFAAILVIYIILGILYESFIHPITILSGLPSAGLGALLALQYFHMDLSVIAIIGILMLVGIVKKNAIMMVDFAIERRKMGDDALTAIRDAALVRFRPIMMTSFAAIFGVLPIALGAGAGAELRQPLGIAVVGGLIVSQLLTLYITPVVYFYLDKVDSWLSGRGRGEREEAVAIPGAVPVAIPQAVHRQQD
ncbi:MULTISPECIES: efflux RND transporter permease subunit [unclassified Bosea (in: a-proteobacteria)]|uniref:efflux RND transporter permease subunit n=1 Tax=unclassified Bosea (in: a-proteobacteria) TaxID=2653178 RepID=UPI000F763110|nr:MULTISPECIES: efflux RND transporter permease subunit [unclassified Bosea (in: a-proteobacteria)]AZO77282.1 acriflavine resistance protein B [Bosea sp. Tri-49]RXT22138.1 acriflavine resistance protein B [Bosea sp. Tri-39]RXT32480.1 acriflavine resistance protein B [Bosea sp. Tri-54]